MEVTVIVTVACVELTATMLLMLNRLLFVYVAYSQDGRLQFTEQLQE